MENEKLDHLFNQLKGTFDNEEPLEGHQQRFLKKLQASQGTVAIENKNHNWIKALTIAASLLLLCIISVGLFYSKLTHPEQVVELSSEASQTQYYFASLIENQVKELENANTPETQKIIDDTMVQLQKLETNFKTLEQNLLNGGNSKLLLSAMITNYQTRIDLLEDVLQQIETIKILKNQNDANYTI